VFSLIETARANGHNPQHYLIVLLTELPAMDNFEAADGRLLKFQQISQLNQQP